MFSNFSGSDIKLSRRKYVPITHIADLMPTLSASGRSRWGRNRPAGGIPQVMILIAILPHLTTISVEPLGIVYGVRIPSLKLSLC